MTRRLFLSLGGVQSFVFADGMTRGPLLHFNSARKAAEAMEWLKAKINFERVRHAFEATSKFAKIVKITTKLTGRYLFIRFVATTGDAMGMNMITKATEAAVKQIIENFPEIDYFSLSGNFCTDKKPAAINWIEGRGKSVVCEAIIPGKIVSEILRTETSMLVQQSCGKNLVGSAVAGTIGGNNAHAANIVAAIFIAMGQVRTVFIKPSNRLNMTN